MKYMLIMRNVDQDAVDEAKQRPFEEILAEMGQYNESMMQAGVLVDGQGLAEADDGVVVDFAEDPPLATDGPYGELKELFNGFWIVETASQEEAVEWAKRAPLGAGSKVEVRRIHGPEDFPQDDEWVKKEIGWREEQAAHHAGP